MISRGEAIRLSPLIALNVIKNSTFSVFLCFCTIFIIPTNFLDLYHFMKEAMEKRNKIGTRVYRFWIGNQLEINVDEPKHMEVIMTNQKFLSKSSQYSFLNLSLGEGLLFSTNKKWFARRRVITPTFHFKILEQFFEVFKKHNKMLLKKLEQKADGQAYNIFPTITASVMDALCGKEIKLSLLVIQ